MTLLARIRNDSQAFSGDYFSSPVPFNLKKIKNKITYWINENKYAKGHIVYSVIFKPTL